MLTGLHGGELLLVAARPAMGKTAFVLNIAHHVAIRKSVPVAMFSLEMSREQLVTRLVAVDSMVDAKSLKTGDIQMVTGLRLSKVRIIWLRLRYL